MDHFDKMTAAIRTAMQIATFGLFRFACCTWGAGRGGDSRGQSTKDRIEMLDDFWLAADHLAVATLQPPYSSTYPDIDIFYSELIQLNRKSPEIYNAAVVSANEPDRHSREFRLDSWGDSSRRTVIDRRRPYLR